MEVPWTQPQNNGICVNSSLHSKPLTILCFRKMRWSQTTAVLVGVACVVMCVFIGDTNAQCLTENDSLDIPSSKDLSPITDFGLDLFKDIFPYNSSNSNFFFSPYSIWNALTLAYFGSGGSTQAELEEVLRLEGKVATLKLWRTLEFL